MSITVFKKWTRAVSYLDEKIKNSHIIAGRNIQLENTGNGIRIHGSASSTQSGDTYTGYFKVVNVSTPTIPTDGETPAQPAVNKLKIVDGMNEDATNCYSGLINKLNKDIPATEVTITQTGVVYLEIVPVYTDDVVSDWTCTFKHAAAMPAYEDKKAFILISRVTFADSKITNFNRENVALPLTVRGDC